MKSISVCTALWRSRHFARFAPAAAIERYLQSMAQRFVDREANKNDDMQLTEFALVASNNGGSDGHPHKWQRKQQKRKAQWGRYHHQMDEVPDVPLLLLLLLLLLICFAVLCRALAELLPRCFAGAPCVRVCVRLRVYVPVCVACLRTG